MSPEIERYSNGADPEPQWQARLSAIAAALPYPPTPDLAWGAREAGQARVGLAAPRRLRPPRPTLRPSRRPVLTWALAVGLLAVFLAAVLLAVPAVRAGLLEFLQIGSVRILFEPTATPTAAPSAALPATLSGAVTAPVATPTPPPTRTPTPSPILSVLDLAGRTTYSGAQLRAPFKLSLPAYPPDLGQPDGAYVQDLGGPAVILVWLAPGDPPRVRLSLQFLSSTAMVDKMLNQDGTPASVQAATVNQRPAVWTSGPYIVRASRGDYVTTRLIQGHVLIWTDGKMTYRLETDLSMAEAVRVAESLGK